MQTLKEICTATPNEITKAFKEVRISRCSGGISVEMWPLLKHGPFQYGSHNDRFVEYEYPEGYVPSWIEPYQAHYDPREIVDEQVDQEAFLRALEYAISLGKPIHIWNELSFYWSRLVNAKRGALNPLRAERMRDERLHAENEAWKTSMGLA